MLNNKLKMFNKDRLAAFERNEDEQHPDNWQELGNGDSDDSNSFGVGSGRASVRSASAPSSVFADDVSNHDTDIGSSTRAESNHAIAKSLSDEESKKVFRLRLAVILVLILTAICVSAAVFKITTDGEMDEFQSQYHGASGKVLDSFTTIMNKMGSVAGLGVAFTSQGKHAGQIDGSHTAGWPFLTLVDFPPRAQNVLELSGALMLGMSPLLAGSQFDEWNDYVNQKENHEWINQSLSYQVATGQDKLHNDESDDQHHHNAESGRTVDVMHYFEQDNVVEEKPGDDWYLPTWQTCPYVREGLVNNNLLRYENSTDDLYRLLENGIAVISHMTTAPPGDMTSIEPETELLATLRSYQGGADLPYHGDPITNLYVPIFDGLVGLNRRVVGVLTAMIHWKSYFNNVLPQNVRGIVVVLEYACAGEEEGAPPEEPINQRRTIEETTEEPRDLATTLTIIEFETTEPTPNSYWNTDLGTTNIADTATDTGNSYWDVNAQASPTPDPGRENWDLDSNSTPPPTNAYWNAAASDPPPTRPPTSPETNPETANWTNPATETPAKPVFNTDDMKEEAAPLKYFSYIIDGTDAVVLGSGDLHDPAYDEWLRKGTFATKILDDGTVTGIPIDQSCSYHVYVYPSKVFYEMYITKTPLIITVVVASVFIFAIVTFLFYNRIVEKRQKKILEQATQSTAIVSSLFPKNVRDRLLAGGDAKGSRFEMGAKSRLKGFMTGENKGDDDDMAAPIADLFPHCTVFFGDISGFTAWSSTREPSQVFILLQTVYQAFDALAKRRRVFKVETIGDCYMAVTGLPDAQEGHACIMVRFAYDCILKMRDVAKKLESQLGPDTTELSMRIGLNSGPVTAGVLRGDRARFQLFGDTVNTASRMESTGERGKIQISESTAALLREVGKEYWLQPRVDAVKAKGKGVLKTYWANPKLKPNSANGSWEGSSHQDDEEEETEAESEEAADALPPAQVRLVDWIVKLMSDDIRKILHARPKNVKPSKIAPKYIPPPDKTCMDEVKEVIHMPKFDAQQVNGDDYKSIQIDHEITRDLGAYVTGVAKLYRNNPFHNFEHACHVTMSVNKLIRRIVAPELNEQGKNVDHAGKLAAQLHDYTYGITSDPLAMFAMTFSALIHDVDHRGISNMQLGVEDPKMKEKYDNKSLAEQHSCDLAWALLNEDRFDNLRKYLFVNEEELMRFRQLIVNIVLATDIFDAELNGLRRKRWQRAFAGEEQEEAEDHSDLRATIVIEHIIQASDVSHTMQHWHVYQKWNKCLFKEMYAAFKAGRLAKDPATFWYKGEIGFFDNYIIPLAKKLKDCNVFGVSSDEYLNYAQQNRVEWEERGQDIVAALVEEVTAADAAEAANPQPERRTSATESRRSSGSGAKKG